MTTNCFPLLLSSLFCPLLVFLFLVSPAALFFRYRSALSSLGTGLQSRGEAVAVWLPAAPLRLLGRSPCVQSKYRVTPAVARCSWVCWQERLAWGEVRFPCHRTLSAIFSAPSDAGPQLQIVVLASRLRSHDHRVTQRGCMWVIGKH